jgi:hypothetical protein
MHGTAGKGQQYQQVDHGRSVAPLRFEGNGA